VVAKVKEKPPIQPNNDMDSLALLLNDTSPGKRPVEVARPALRLAKSDTKAVPTATTAKLSEPPKAKKRSADRGRDPALSDYLSALGKTPLLTAEQEISWARELAETELSSWTIALSHPTTITTLRSQHADDLADVAELTPARLRHLDEDGSWFHHLLPHLPAALVARIEPLRKKAMAVRNRFVRSNLRLVVSVARRFHHHRMALIDLIQEGNLGLIKSVHRYDHTKGFRFSTYAHWWIRQAIERAIMNKGCQIRLPVHIFDARRELQKATRDIQQTKGREPTLAELVHAMQLEPHKVTEVLLAVPREPASLDDPIGGDEDRTLSEVLGSDQTAPDELVIAVEQKARVRRLFAKLTPMEADILTRRYGLDNDEDETLEEIGASYRLSRERVRQIQVQGLKKIQKIVVDA
jgi:RNA polymerase sigma factor (sigma-70 family)